MKNINIFKSPQTDPKREVYTKNQTTVRDVEQSDIGGLVDVDIECFSDVYENNPPVWNEVYEMLESRRQNAQGLMLIGQVEGRAEGFMTCQRINKSENEIVSWDDTTNYGTLDNTHQPDGKTFYVVNLTVTGKGSEHNLGDLLIGEMMKRFVESHTDQAYLLSRIPQFQEWLKQNNIEFDELTVSEQDELVNSYVFMTKEVNGKQVLYDGMLRRYASFGVKPVKAMRDGFKDPLSHDYSVLCRLDNPLPAYIRKNKIVSKIAGKAIRTATRHPKILDKF